MDEAYHAMPGTPQQSPASPSIVGPPQLPEGAHSLHRAPSYIPKYRPSAVNPFVNSTVRLPWHQTLKIIILGVTILPIKLCLTILNLLVMWIFARAALIGLSDAEIDQPWPKWRRALKHPIALGLRFQLLLFGFWRVRIKGRCAEKSAAPIIIGNHVSPFEPFFLVSLTRATPVQRIEDSRAPIIGTIQKAMQTVFVDRADPASRRLTVEAISRRSSHLEGFPQVLIFPEGTATNQRALITFKQGAFSPGLPIQPVLVKYPYRHLDPSFPAVAPQLLDLFLRVMCQFVNHMEIEFLDVYSPSAEERASPSLYAANLQRLLAAHLGVPATQHAYEDVALQFAAMKLKLPAETAVVEWHRLRQELQITTATAKEWLAIFKNLDKDHDGKLTYEEFAAGWRRKHARVGSASPVVPRPVRTGSSNTPTAVPNPSWPTAPGATASPRRAAAVLEEELAKAFALFDTKGEGKVDFRQFLTGLAVLNGMGHDGRRDALKFAFSCFTDKGQFTRQELETLVRRLFPTMPQDQLVALLNQADPENTGVISRTDFIRVAEAHDEVFGHYQTALTNDILGSDVELDALERGWGVVEPTSAAGAIGNPLRGAAAAGGDGPSLV